MLSDGVRTGKYKDPQLASKIVSGTIYDSNGYAMAISISSYDLYFVPEKLSNQFEACKTLSKYANMPTSALMRKLTQDTEGSVLMLETVPQNLISSILEDLEQTNPQGAFFFQKNSKRTYPSTYHAGNLILQTEKALTNILNPRPGFNETVTYGSSVNLTIVNEIQYLLDMAVQSLDKEFPSSYLSMVVDYETGAVLAMTSTPFLNPETSDTYSNLAFCDSLKVDDITIKPYFIESLKDRNYKEVGFSYSNETFDTIMNGNGTYSLSRFPSKDNPKYVLLICSDSDVPSSAFEKANYTVYNGLATQGRF